MQAFIGATLLTSKETQPQSKPFEIYDSRLPGFTLRVQPSGVRSYYARFGRNRRVVLGKVGTLAPEEARERCQKVGRGGQGQESKYSCKWLRQHTGGRSPTGSMSKQRRLLVAREVFAVAPTLVLLDLGDIRIFVVFCSQKHIQSTVPP